MNHAHSCCQVCKKTTFLIFEITKFTLLDNSSIFYYDYSVAFFDRRKSVSNNNWRSSDHHVIESFLNFSLRFLVESTCGFIENKYRGFSNNCSCNCNSLFLTTRKLAPFYAAFNFETWVERLISELVFSIVHFTFNWLELSFLFFFLCKMFKFNYIIVELFLS